MRSNLFKRPLAHLPDHGLCQSIRLNVKLFALIENLLLLGPVWLFREEVGGQVDDTNPTTTLRLAAPRVVHEPVVTTGGAGLHAGSLWFVVGAGVRTGIGVCSGGYGG